VTPAWKKDSRIYYTGNLNFHEADDYASEGKWKEASEIWEKYTGSANHFLAETSSYNMAVAKEISGDLEEALRWAEKSYSYYKTWRTKQYIKQLKKRVKQAEKLEIQM
jgi:tetratricopeptide (TPR) repeat protein